MRVITREVVALTQCPATEHTDGDEVEISGLFRVVEWHHVEPSAYVWSECVTVARDEDSTEDPDISMYTIDAGVFIEQTDPKLHTQMLREERMMQEAAEQMDKAERIAQAREDERSM